MFWNKQCGGKAQYRREPLVSLPEKRTEVAAVGCRRIPAPERMDRQAIRSSSNTIPPVSNALFEVKPKSLALMPDP